MGFAPFLDPAVFFVAHASKVAFGFSGVFRARSGPPQGKIKDELPALENRSGSAATACYIDGVDTVAIVSGVQGKNLTLEFVREVQVKIGGPQAEVGRAPRGIIDVLTGSGDDEFHGAALGNYFSNYLQANRNPREEGTDHVCSRAPIASPARGTCRTTPGWP